jgi:cytochrome c-type biogenesis protein CcmH
MMRVTLRVPGLLLALGLLLPLTLAASEPLQFASAEQQARFERLAAELRCLVCQNQSLADSDAELAHDLRREVLDMLQAGRSDEEIKRFLVDRYGDFVLYRPPVQANTLLLWLAPGLLLATGVLVVGFNVRKRSELLAQEDAADGERDA